MRIYFLTRVKVEEWIFLRVIELLDAKVGMYVILRVNEGENCSFRRENQYVQSNFACYRVYGLRASAQFLNWSSIGEIRDIETATC